MEKLCDEQWPVIDRQVAKALGVSQWETPEGTRREVFQRFRSGPGVSSYDPRKASDTHLLAKAFRQHALATATTTAQAAIHVAVNVSPREMAKLRRKHSVTGVPKAQGRRPARLQRSDAQNLELLSFVVERIIPFGQLMAPRLDEDGEDVRLLPGHRGPQVAVPRQALADEWNRTHLHWSMSSGDVLMGQFYRAAARPHLRGGFLQQVRLEIAEEWDKQHRRLERVRQLYAESHARLTEEEREERERRLQVPIQISEEDWAPVREAQQQLRELIRKQKARFSSEEQYQEWLAKREAEREEKYRASLTRKDLIEKRVLWLVRPLRGTDPQEEQQLRQSPLRDWFLPEARDGRLRLHRWHWGRLRHDAGGQFADARG